MATNHPDVTDDEKSSGFCELARKKDRKEKLNKAMKKDRKSSKKKKKKEKNGKKKEETKKRRRDKTDDPCHDHHGLVSERDDNIAPFVQTAESVPPSGSQEIKAVEMRKRRKPDESSVEMLSSKPTASAGTSHSNDEERPMVESSVLPVGKEPNDPEFAITLLLFYQYVEPAWNEQEYKIAKHRVVSIANEAGVTGRMRVAKEGLNCTLTSSRDGIRSFCTALRQWKPHNFAQTEFKLTHHMPEAQRFQSLKLIPVLELVHYGLDGVKAPSILNYQGKHLEPVDYHEKLAEKDTVVIDVRNHYEAIIGRFDPPVGPDDDDCAKGVAEPKDSSSNETKVISKYIDPKMRKSTEFPVWLDKPETKEMLAGKQVLMYCTGGIRCERASALLRYKMEHDPSIKKLGIKGVYQLQGGIDKYFKEFPDGGYWKGKNYTFDKRFAHAPVEKEMFLVPGATSDSPMGTCESCHRPWDKFRGKRRCPTCGVPSLICKDCWQADQNGSTKLDRVRCDLCVEQNIKSKKALRDKEQRELQQYEESADKLGLLKASARIKPNNVVSQVLDMPRNAPNPSGITRLFLRNMCRNSMTEDVLADTLPGITHIFWRTDRKTGQFFGQGWVEMESPDAAAAAVARSGEVVVGRPLYIEYQPADSKDAWPPPKSAIQRR